MAAVGFILISASFIISAVGMTCLPLIFFNRTFPLDRACLASGQVASTTITRGDWCDVFKKAANDGVALSDAMRGLHVHAATVPWEFLKPNCGTRSLGSRWIACPGNGTKPNVSTNTVVNELIEGISKDLMGLMSARWGFNYTFYQGPPRPSDLSVTKWQEKFGHAYDLIMHAGADTAERRKTGFLIPYGIWDSSPRLIVNLEKVDPDFWDTMIGFTKPFTATSRLDCGA
jgi:hypothetical protein